MRRTAVEWLNQIGSDSFGIYSDITVHRLDIVSVIFKAQWNFSEWLFEQQVNSRRNLDNDARIGTELLEQEDISSQPTSMSMSMRMNLEVMIQYRLQAT